MNVGTLNEPASEQPLNIVGRLSQKRFPDLANSN
jgi:hypothetical protein